MPTRAMAFYSAITSALFGYVLTRELSPRFSILLVGAAVAISFIVFVALGAWIWGLTRIVNLLESLTVQMEKQVYEDLRMKTHFRTWRHVNRVIMVGTALVGVVIIVGLLIWGRWATQV